MSVLGIKRCLEIDFTIRVGYILLSTGECRGISPRGYLVDAGTGRHRVLEVEEVDRCQC